jgi:hypothetical protein
MVASGSGFFDEIDKVALVGLRPLEQIPAIADTQFRRRAEGYRGIGRMTLLSF